MLHVSGCQQSFGQQSFADPRNGIAYGYTRRRFLFPAVADPENDRIIRALYAAAGTVSLLAGGRSDGNGRRRPLS